MSSSLCPVATGLDLLAPDVLADPYAVFNQLRDEGPVAYLPALDHYVITRYEDIEQVLLDRDTWSAANASSPLNPPCPAAQEVLKAFPRVPTLNNADPPRHGPMRKSVLAVMSPRRLKALEPVLHDRAVQLVRAVADRPVVDIVEALAFPFPGEAAFSLLGFPPDDTAMLKDWSAQRVLLTYGRLDEARQVEIANTVVSFWRYCEDHVAARRAQRADDMTSDLVDLADAKPEQLNDADVVNIVYSIALAAHETISNTIGNGIRALLSHREQWQALVDDPALIPNAVEEILRYDGPVFNHRRTAKVDTEVGGVPIPAGAKVMMCFGSAGHDPSQFSDPETFDIARGNAELHLAFGKGPHYCLGAPLARIELRIVLELLTSLTPAMELVPEQELVYNPNALFRGLRAMLVAPMGLAGAELG